MKFLTLFTVFISPVRSTKANVVAPVTSTFLSCCVKFFKCLYPNNHLTAPGFMPMGGARVKI